MNYRRVSSVAGIVLAVGLLQSVSALAQDEVQFKGKRIEAIIVSSPGGGTDASTRLVGRFLQKHLPGHPEITYRNIPAGQGVTGLNYFAKQGRPDGLVWVGGGEPHVSSVMLAKEAVEYNPLNFRYFGGVSRGGSVIVLRKEKEKNLTDRSLPPVIVGEIDGSRTWGQLIMWGADILGWNIKFVVGYPGTGALALAGMRGEIDMFGTSGLNELNQILAKGFIAVTQDGAIVDGKFAPRSDFKEAPVFADMTAGKLSGLAKEAFEFWLGRFQMDKFFALPAGTSDAHLAVYRTSYVAVFKDPEFMKAAELQFGADFNAVTGEAVRQLVERGAYPKKEITAYIEGLKVKYGLPTQPLRDDEIAKLAKERGFAAAASSVSVTLQAVSGEGRQISFESESKSHTIEVSSGRTAITIGGKTAGRGNLKAGMICQVTYSESGADIIACK